MAKIDNRFIRHDENASRDEKILRMREKYGARGYGLYWEIIEYLFTCAGRAELNPKIVSLAIGEDVRAVRNFLSDCIEIYQLFESNGTHFWSNRLTSEIDRIIDMSHKKSNAAKVRHQRDLDNALSNIDLEQRKDIVEPCTCTASALQEHCRNTAIDEKDEIEKKESSYGKQKPHQFLRPSIEEIEAYCLERGNDIDPVHFHDYYEANGWKIGKNPMKSWKAAIRTWEKNSTVKTDKPSKSYDPYDNLRRLV
jgi:hypothetical protein